ncbi:hypothetical protein [Pseudonocardia sp. T1-2H]|uniref:hypothetical protein n=1 Tax=Pseudonocardia sp. T1-2H TaxID=3128899 RepID=UPI00310161C5
MMPLRRPAATLVEHTPGAGVPNGLHEEAWDERPPGRAAAEELDHGLTAVVRRDPESAG